MNASRGRGTIIGDPVSGSSMITRSQRLTAK